MVYLAAALRNPSTTPLGVASGLRFRVSGSETSRPLNYLTQIPLRNNLFILTALLPVLGKFVDVADPLLGAAHPADVVVGRAPAKPAFFEKIVPALDLKHREIRVQSGAGAVFKVNAPGAFFRHAFKTFAGITIQKMRPVKIHSLDIRVVQFFSDVGDELVVRRLFFGGKLDGFRLFHSAIRTACPLSSSS